MRCLIEGGIFIKAAARSDAGLEAEDRLHTLVKTDAIKLNRAVHGSGVGEGESLEAPLFRGLHERLDLGQAVKQRIVRMDVEVNKAGHSHE